MILNKSKVLVCQGTGCESSNSSKIRKNLIRSVKDYNLEDYIEVKFTGCHGFCQQGPIVVIEPEGSFYTNVKVKDAEKIVYKHFIEKTPLERLFYKDPATLEYIQKYSNITFYKNQKRIILRNCGHINPENINEYIELGGYSALQKVLTNFTPEEVIKEISKSNLRGRGGAGFPTGLKWKFCCESKVEPKYVICNADEGDPGAFMDRSTLEGDPHSVLEGIIIAAYAIGASSGYIYIRAEYPLAVKRFRKAIEDARENGFIGENILGSKYCFDFEIFEGAGAFVCGEETALLASIMGQRGNPVSRPPYPTTSGLWGRPTNINNVKTYASVPVIINKGADWYTSIGTKDSAGTAVFALTGKISNSGLIEVPFGTTLREIICTIGGGIPNGKDFKGVQTGGPSGGCLPSSYLDSPVDYKTMADAGSIIGSGGMIVLDNDDCVVKLAHYFLTFIQSESCGKCVPCRVGTKTMLDILKQIIDGKGKDDDIDLLEELAIYIQKTSLCGLGQTAPNPVLTTIRHYREEYLSHIKANICPARECRSMIEYRITEEKCNGCTMCSRNCPVNAISGKKGEIHFIDQASCTKCGMCFSSCAIMAIRKCDNMIEELIV